MTLKVRFCLSGLMALLFVLPTFAMAEEPLSPEQIRDTMAKVESRITALRELTAQIEQAPEIDRNTLRYRRDERSFELLAVSYTHLRAHETLTPISYSVFCL